DTYHSQVSLLWLFPFTGSVATSCEACHPNASVICNCREGYVGDGLNCYDRTACQRNDSCCDQGYRWSSELGCVDVDECSLPDQPCAGSQVCENTLGSFTCLVSPEDPHTQGPRSVLFGCGGTQCPAGQDCLSINGTTRCGDPCQIYTELNDSWRSTNVRANHSAPECDSRGDWRGWYRMFIGNASVQMPERCISSHLCGTDAPLWLRTPHPVPSDGIVKRRVCGSWERGCCQFQSNPIHVKACPGNYYVYKFVSPTLCRLAYCFSITINPFLCLSSPLPLSLSLSLSLCLSAWPTFPDPELLCGQNLLQVGLQREALEAAGLNASSAHLADRRCVAHVERNGQVWYQVERREGRCGNLLKVRGINIPNVNVCPLFEWCSRKEVGVVGIGARATATMSLYRNTDYTEPFPAGQITLPIGSVLHVGVAVEESETGRLVVVLETCYATPSPNPDDHMQYPLIQNRSVQRSDPTQVTVDESGSSLRARFSALLFLYQGDYRDVYLHCSLSLCDRGSQSCTISRSVSSPVSRVPLTIGPISCKLFLTDRISRAGQGERINIHPC
uniref:ZP domain-containing protein n=1 Tax=Esox lucius TaxID=8010 RepID=A0A3P8XCU4_ESOLU